MDDSSFVRGVQRVRNLDGQRQHRLYLQLLAADAVLQRHAIQKLHDDEGSAMLVINLMDRADVWMIQSRSSLSFALEAAEGLRIIGYFVGGELEGHEAAEFHILRFVNHNHPATAELLDDAVVRDALGQNPEVQEAGKSTKDVGVT